jgi:hypothetical protein
MRKCELNETYSFNLKIYIACNSNSFYEEAVYLFQAFVDFESNLVFKGNKFGLPSMIAKSNQPILTINEFIYESSMKLITNLFNLNDFSNEHGLNEAYNHENHTNENDLISSRGLLFKSINEELKNNFSSLLDSFDLNKMKNELEAQIKQKSHIEHKSLQQNNQNSRKSSTATIKQSKSESNVLDALKSTCLDYISSFHQT